MVISAFEAVYGPEGTSGLVTTRPGGGGAGEGTGGGDAGAGGSPGLGTGASAGAASTGPKIVRFERRVPGGEGREDGDVVPMTYVRLPEPVRFDISQMR